MAESVEAALENRQHLIVEAGTGTGKTLAYLVPLLRSGLRTVISTGTKNLQEQLFLQRRSFPQEVVPADARHADEGAPELSLPAEALRHGETARPRWHGAGGAVPETAPVGRKHGNRRPRGIALAAGRERAMEKGGCPPRGLHGAKVPAVRALLHHPDASARRRSPTCSS